MSYLTRYTQFVSTPASYPTADYDVSNKKYVDDRAKAYDVIIDAASTPKYIIQGNTLYYVDEFGEKKLCCNNENDLDIQE